MLYIGTTNDGKVAEIAALLSPLRVQLQPVALDVPETEDSFEGNARLKGLAYAKHTGGVTISEDSGLIVPALSGLPGPWSARFSDCTVVSHGRLSSEGKEVPESFRIQGLDPSGRPREEMDRLNNDMVLDLLAGFEQPKRAAMFKVVLVVAQPGKILFEASGECHGWIAPETRGDNGFGYDPIFIGQDTFGKTFAELDTPRKNLRSHRKRVLDELFMWASQHTELL